MFADPVADIAVLSEPDRHELSHEWETYGESNREVRRHPDSGHPKKLAANVDTNV